MKKIGSVNYHTKSCTKYSLPLQQNQQFKQAFYLKDGNISGNSPPLSTFVILSHIIPSGWSITAL